MTEAGFRAWIVAGGRATHTYPDKLLRYDGIFAVKLEDRLCREFREWWNVREEPPPG